MQQVGKIHITANSRKLYCFPKGINSKGSFAVEKGKSVQKDTEP